MASWNLTHTHPTLPHPSDFAHPGHTSQTDVWGTSCGGVGDDIGVVWEVWGALVSEWTLRIILRIFGDLKYWIYHSSIFWGYLEGYVDFFLRDVWKLPYFGFFGCLETTSPVILYEIIEGPLETITLGYFRKLWGKLRNYNSMIFKRMFGDYYTCTFWEMLGDYQT